MGALVFCGCEKRRRTARMRVATYWLLQRSVATAIQSEASCRGSSAGCRATTRR